MEMTQAVDALAALAQETRLGIYRLLVAAGPEGMAAGKIGEAMKLPPATLSFHLAHLARTGLVQPGSRVRYRALVRLPAPLAARETREALARRPRRTEDRRAGRSRRLG